MNTYNLDEKPYFQKLQIVAKNMQNQLQNYRKNMLIKISQNIIAQLQSQHCDNDIVFQLITEQLYYTHYDTEDWEKNMMYLIYQSQPLKQMQDQYIKTFEKYEKYIKKDIPKFYKSLNDYITQSDQKRKRQIKFIRNQYQNKFQKNDKYTKSQQETVGILLNPYDQEEKFLMIRKNNLGQIQFQRHLKKSYKEFKQFLIKYRKIFQKDKNQLNKFYQQLGPSFKVLLSDINYQFDRFQKQYNKIKVHLKKQQNEQKFKNEKLALNAYKHYLLHDNVHQNYCKNKNRYQKNKKQYYNFKSFLQIEFQNMFKTCFYWLQLKQIQQIINQCQQTQMIYGFPKGKRTWFQNDQKACRRECFQQTKLDISELKLEQQSKITFDVQRNKQSKSYIFYVNKIKEKNNHIRGISNYNYEVLKSKFYLLFKKPTEQLILECKQKEWKQQMCKQIIQKNIKKGVNVGYGQICTILEFFKFLESQKSKANKIEEK